MLHIVNPVCSGSGKMYAYNWYLPLMNDNDVEKTKTNFISSTDHVSETLCLPLIPTTAVLNPVPWSQHVKSLIPLIFMLHLFKLNTMFVII